NLLHIIILYDRLRDNPMLDVPPRTFFFAGKGVAAYAIAELIIKLINNFAGEINASSNRTILRSTRARSGMQVRVRSKRCWSYSANVLPKRDYSLNTHSDDPGQSGRCHPEKTDRARRRRTGAQENPGRSHARGSSAVTVRSSRPSV